MSIRRALRTYGPTFRWRRFRLTGDPSNRRWMPIRVTQIIGGKTWSLAITRNEPYRDGVAPAVRDGDGLT